MPLIVDGDLASNWKKKQASFFTSLGYLASLYHFEPLSVRISVYPNNVWMAYRHAKNFVEKVDKEIELYIVEASEDELLLATGKTYSTMNQLYYFPLEPVSIFVQQKEEREASRLLLSVLAYCFQVLQLPSYTEKDYLEYCYNSVLDWLLSDGESEEDSEHIAEIERAFREGEKISRQCKKRHHLTSWKRRLTDFVPSNEKHESILKIAKEAFALYNEFPAATFHQNIFPSFNDPLEEGSVHADQYISFSWSAEGWLQEQEFECVNNELQEWCAIDEPIILQCFDKPQGRVNLDDSFEIKLFSFLQNLSIFLYNEL